MSADMFEPTIPAGEPELMRASTYQRYLEELDADAPPGGVSSRIASLGPSLMADLLRFENEAGGSELLEVMAACVRHTKRVTMQLQNGDRVVPLTVFPHERLVHCPLALDELLGKDAAELRVMHIEPALRRPPGDPEAELVGDDEQHHALTPLLWDLAMRGLRRNLLPEIAGPAVYRVVPALDIAALPISGALLASVLRLQRQAAGLRELSDWPGLDRDRAIRLLNALYLQAGLIVSRTHPDAVREKWF